MPHQEPDWLAWARRLLAIAQTGTAYAASPYDRERYAEIREVAAGMLQHHTGIPARDTIELFAQDIGYATPKVEVRAAVFDVGGRLLLVQETADQNRWTLPGGWADVNITAAHNAVKEVAEESGYQVAVTKLAAVWDHASQGHSPSLLSCYKMFFICRLVGGHATSSHETSGSGWFARGNIPNELSQPRVNHRQIMRMFEHADHPGLAADFD